MAQFWVQYLASQCSQAKLNNKIKKYPSHKINAIRMEFMESSSYENWDKIEMLFGHLVICNLQLVIGNKQLVIGI